MGSRLILMRHGMSAWNKKRLFTGWVDIPLSEEGVHEVMEGGKKMRHLPIDVGYTSTLVRAQMTLALALLHHESGKIPVFQHPQDGKRDQWWQIHSEETRRETIPVYMAWELNERMYGDLQGMNKQEMAERYGKDLVQRWRRSFSLAPPHGESLEMTAARTLPYFRQRIMPHLERGESVFLAGHGNSLRAIMMDLDGLSQEEVVHLEIPTGEPFLYMWEGGRWNRQPLL
jgi:2,3-bisphosphoglycerate-dependent phosphoglycerate mutase